MMSKKTPEMPLDACRKLMGWKKNGTFILAFLIAALLYADISHKST